jgi:amino acid permease
LGGAIANSGGLISIVAILTFAVLSKYSFDLVVSLGLQSSSNHQESSYEGLGYATYGSTGKLTVILSKGLYSYGCNVAYIKIIKDNFSLAALQLLYGDSSNDHDDDTGALRSIIQNQDLVTVLLCATIMFPLCLLRDLTPLERFSILKMVAVMAIVLIVISLFFVLEDDETTQESGFVENWLTVRGGVWER